MGEVQSPRPVMPLLAAFSRHDAALDWARDTAVRHWGPVKLESEVFRFNHTEYYSPTMGTGLKKLFFAFQPGLDPGELPTWKHTTNSWEVVYRESSSCPESRPLNLDPGYISESKLVLASTKDFAHRIYMRAGIYAEVTLHYRSRGWQPHEWTFADYRQPEYLEFFDRCRNYLRETISRNN